MSDRHTVPPVEHIDGDRFTRWGDDAAEMLQEHIMKVVALVALLIVGGVGWTLYTNQQEASRIEALGKVAVIARTFPGEISEPEPAPVLIERAAEQYETFLQSAKPGAARNLATLNLGRAREALGDTEAARALYESLKSSPGAFSSVARMRLGFLAAEAGDIKSAGAAFESVVSDSPGFAPQAALELGRLAESTGSEMAIEVYRSVALRFSESLQASEAEARIRALGGEVEEPQAVVPMPGEASGETTGEASGGAATDTGEAPAEATTP
ncbi:MAG: tol-pal system YbgF family protein [Leptospirillia bacterium]